MLEYGKSTPEEKLYFFKKTDERNAETLIEASGSDSGCDVTTLVLH